MTYRVNVTLANWVSGMTTYYGPDIDALCEALADLDATVEDLAHNAELVHRDDRSATFRQGYETLIVELEEVS